MTTSRSAGDPVAEPLERLDLRRVREEVDATLERFLDDKARTAPDPCLPALVDVLRDRTSGGERLRALFCHCGWIAAGGAPDGRAVVRTGVALELVHSSALLHDDAAGVRGPHGRDTAALLGELCSAWADEVLGTTAVNSGRRYEVHSLVHALRTELVAGRYLELTAAQRPDADPWHESWRVLRLRTARCAVELPLRIGAALAGADRGLHAVLTAYGRPVGEACGLREDLLGAFGDPVPDDLRKGRRTVLMALALRHATPAQREVVDALHGDPELDREGAERLREVVRETGAVARVEELIAVRVDHALAALRSARVAPAVERALAGLAASAGRGRGGP